MGRMGGLEVNAFTISSSLSTLTHFASRKNGPACVMIGQENRSVTRPTIYSVTRQRL